MNWFYLLKSDELREAIEKRDKFLKRYGDGNSRNNYYKLPKALRFIGPLQPLGELRGEKWLDGDWYLSGKPSYDMLKDIRAIDLTFTFPFNFEKDESENKDIIGYISGPTYTNIEVEILGTERIFNNYLGIKQGKYKFAIMDFIEIYNQPDNKYKNLRAYIDLGEEIKQVSPNAIDYKYVLKQIIDMEEEENVKIQLYKTVGRPKFVIVRKKPRVIKEKPMLRRLKL